MGVLNLDGGYKFKWGYNLLVKLIHKSLFKGTKLKVYQGLELQLNRLGNLKNKCKTMSFDKLSQLIDINTRNSVV